MFLAGITGLREGIRCRCRRRRRRRRRKRRTARYKWLGEIACSTGNHPRITG
jgi:hypothetical protein